MLQRSSGFLPPVHTNCRVGFGVFSVKPGCHNSGSIRNYLVYLPPAHRVKKTRGVVIGRGKAIHPAKVETEEIFSRLRHNGSTVGKRTSPRKQRTRHQKKGDALENAVNRIEQYLLKITPELSERDFKFETKKQVTVDGGRREIDIYVTRRAAHGYDSIFIYECRNREKAVNWADIAAFSRKIEATRATWGCFVAKKFAKTARSEAKKDSRIRLLVAEEILEPVDLFVHFPQLTSLNVTLRRLLGGEPVDYGTMPEPQTYYRGWAVPLKQMLIGVAQQVCMEDIHNFLSTTPNEGIHQFEKHATLPLPRFELIVDGKEIAATSFDINYQVRVVRTAVVSQFHVEGRGRYIQAENAKCGEFEVPVEIVVANPRPSGN